MNGTEEKIMSSGYNEIADAIISRNAYMSALKGDYRDVARSCVIEAMSEALKKAGKDIAVSGFVAFFGELNAHEQLNALRYIERYAEVTCRINILITESDDDQLEAMADALASFRETL